MKLPAPPPPGETILHDAMQSGRLFELLAASAQYADPFLHWDALRYRKAPGDLSATEWWGALKFKRLTAAREIALRDTTGKPFRYCLPDQALANLHEIDRGFGMLIGTSEGLLNQDLKDQYLMRSLITEATASSQLEGASTTRLAAAEMLQSGRRPRDSSERMIYNNFATMQMLSQWKTAPLTIEMLLEIHRMVTEESLDDPDAAGRFRNAGEPIVVRDRGTNTVLHVPPPAGELLERMERLCEFANATEGAFVHPAVRAILLHLWLAYDHPFVDGNGRTARALFYWSMLRAGYWALEFISISEIILRAPAKYARAFLYTESDDNDATYFLLHQLGVIQDAKAELHAYLTRKDNELRGAEDLLAIDERLNYRQRILLAHALRHPGARYTCAIHQKMNGIVYETARKDLTGLRDLGFLVMRKVGKAYHFTTSSDLRTRMTAR